MLIILCGPIGTILLIMFVILYLLCGIPYKLLFERKKKDKTEK